MAAKIPVRRALTWIATSMLGTLLVALVCWHAYGYLLIRRAADPAYQLFALIQTGPEKEALKSSYLEELLGLAKDHPTNLYAFDCAAARKRLLASPLIKDATVTTYLPGTVYVDYSVRKPAAYVRDYSNTAVDAEGVLIPSDPFFTPKRLPEFYLGLPLRNQVWGRSIQGTQLALAFDLKAFVETLFSRDATKIKCIDVSLAEATSFGQREVVLTLEERLEWTLAGRTLVYVQPVVLRLDPSRYVEALTNYITLRGYLTAQTLKLIAIAPPTSQTLPGRTVDLRLPQLGYLLRE